MVYEEETKPVPGRLSAVDNSKKTFDLSPGFDWPATFFVTKTEIT